MIEGIGEEVSYLQIPSTRSARSAGGRFKDMPLGHPRPGGQSPGTTQRATGWPIALSVPSCFAQMAVEAPSIPPTALSLDA